MSIRDTRAALLRTLFPQGVPRLWCPPITHTQSAGAVDRARTEAHHATLAPFVGGFLVPGSTGEGWAMSPADVLAVLKNTLEIVQNSQSRILVGILATTTEAMHANIDAVLNVLHTSTGTTDSADAMAAANVVGFTVCPPKGAEHSQAQIESELSSILDRGLPVALYQLPQITQNEMAPDTVANLAARYPNFIMFKDTSGADRVALSGIDLQGVYRVRGAEGEYANWPKVGGGPYDGFLLSTANGFAMQLHQILEYLSQGNTEPAHELSQRLSTAVAEVFDSVAGLTIGNPFANANKLIDHLMAFGADAPTAELPLTWQGEPLPRELVTRTAEILQRSGLLPSRGYLTPVPTD